MMISSGSARVGWWVTACAALALGACASNKASSNNNGGSSSSKGQTQQSGSGGNTTSQPAAPPPAEEDALIRVKDKMFPPVDVGSWLCEPKSWNDKGQVQMHCTAPAGTKGLTEALKADPSVADVESSK